MEFDENEFNFHTLKYVSLDNVDWITIISSGKVFYENFKKIGAVII